MMNKSVNGMGKVYGGEYDAIEINGTGTVAEDVTCNSLSINGTGRVKGSIRAKVARISGAGRFDKGFAGGELAVSGAAQVKGSVEADRVTVAGTLSCKGEVNADLFSVDGIVNVDAFVGDRLEMRPHKGTNIRIGRKKWARSRIGTVECTCVQAANLEAGVIRAQEVHLGENCKVDVIECDGPVTWEQDCTVGRVIKDGETVAVRNGQKEERPVKNISVVNILDAYKAGDLSAAEAEEMLGALVGTAEPIAAEGGSIGLPNDETLRFVAAKGGRILTAREMNRRDARFTVEYQGDVLNVECRGSLQCGNVEGNAAAGDALTCGSIAGNANAGDSLNCGGDIGGNVNAGDSVTCGGSVGDSIRAGDSVRVEGDVGGSVTAGDHVNCGNVGADVRADGSVTCGNVEGSIRAGGNVRHG